VHAGLCKTLIRCVCRVGVIYHARDNNRRGAVFEQVNFFRQLWVGCLNVVEQVRDGPCHAVGLCLPGDDEAVKEAAKEAGVQEEDFGLSGKEAGPRLTTVFVKLAPDLGYDHAVQFGGWGAWASQQQEVHEEPVIHALEGDAWMWGLDAVYKYSAGRSHGHGDVKLQAEYLRQGKDLAVTYHKDNPAIVGADRDFSEDGFYVQGWYGFAPRWRLGLRYDKVGLINEVTSGGATLKEWDSSDRWTAALTWAPTEFSQLRLQYARADLSVDDGKREAFNSLYLQWMMSLGTHGAHKF